MGAFKVCNSWGTDYCNNGYVWLSYDAINKVSSVNNDYLNTNNNSRLAAIQDDTLAKRVDVSFDGTKELSSGTFVVNLSNLGTSLSADEIKNSTWILRVYDNNNNGAVTKIKNFKIINGDNKVIKDANIPIYLEKDFGSNIVKICANKDFINNYCSILVRFRSGYDNTVSKIYELSSKEYTIENGKAKDKEDIFDISYFNTTKINFDNFRLDGDYLIANTTINSKDVKYRFSYIDNRTNKSHTLKGYSTCNYVKINFSGYCDYTLVVQAKYVDKVAESSFDFIKDYDNYEYLTIKSNLGNTIKEGDKTRIIADTFCGDAPSS